VTEVETYWKVPFVRSSDGAPPVDRLPPDARWVTAHAVGGFVDLVADCMAASADAWDNAAVAALGAARAAELVTTGLSGYHHDPDWWQVLTVDDVPAGFVLPAVFEGCDRDGLDEATIVHIGVHPSRRGRGLARLLLRQATRALVGHGVWRIYCDTAAANRPMIHLFETEGWERQPPHQRPVFTRQPDR
jgi:GNAT superfamily N-acetyltransferase